MTPIGLDILTHSRMQCFKTCPKKHYFHYLLGIRRERESQPLRFGGNFHLGLDLLAQGKDLAFVVNVVRSQYEDVPAWADAYDWAIECEQVIRLLCGYVWRWGEDGCEVLSTESVFCLPIRNPETGAATNVFKVSGKKDKIVRLEDGRIALREHKTTGDPIDPDSDYWKRVRLDHQITLYFWAAKELGYDIQTIEYDVIKKPTIGPKRGTPEESRKYKKDGTLYANQRETDESVQEYGDRLTEDIGKRPEFYYQRQEVPRLQSDIDEFLGELWDQQKIMRMCELSGRHPRNTQACTMPYRCEYLDVCHGSGDFSQGLPEGFIQVTNIHTELGEGYADTTTGHKAAGTTTADKERKHASLFGQSAEA